MKHTNIKEFVRRMLIGSVSIMVMLVFWPALCTHAQFSFPTDLFNTVTSLGNWASKSGHSWPDADYTTDCCLPAEFGHAISVVYQHGRCNLPVLDVTGL